jgi:hypothetical protein
MTDAWAGAAAFLVGLSPWIVPNALYAEIPAITDEIPEGAAIGAYVSLAIQALDPIANSFVLNANPHGLGTGLSTLTLWPEVSGLSGFAFFALQRYLTKPLSPGVVMSFILPGPLCQPSLPLSSFCQVSWRSAWRCHSPGRCLRCCCIDPSWVLTPPRAGGRVGRIRPDLRQSLSRWVRDTLQPEYMHLPAPVF